MIVRPFNIAFFVWCVAWLTYDILTGNAVMIGIQVLCLVLASLIVASDIIRWRQRQELSEIEKRLRQLSTVSTDLSTDEDPHGV